VGYSVTTRAGGAPQDEQYERDGETIFKRACKLGCEGVCQNGLARIIDPGVRRIGLKSKIPKTRGRGGVAAAELNRMVRN
jgi:hypothetical protein